MIATSKLLAACMMLASQTYTVPPAVLVGIYKVEGGKIGQEVHNKNGSYDLGPMQINTIHIDGLAKKWDVDKTTAHQWVRDDACTNVGVAAWLLKGHLDRTGNLSTAIAHYHSKTPSYGSRYKKKVINVMKANDLIRPY